jgi:hypothetical protein
MTLGNDGKQQENKSRLLPRNHRTSLRADSGAKSTNWPYRISIGGIAVLNSFNVSSFFFSFAKAKPEM